MEPLTAIALAGKIASATGLGDWVKEKLGDKVGDNAAQKIVDVAKVVTGAETPKEALLRVERNQELAHAVKENLLQREHELILAAMQDVQSARDMYTHTGHTMADNIAQRVIKWNVWAVVALLACNGLVLAYIEDSTISLALGNLIGVSVNALWQERQQVIGFFFGSSLGSKLKTQFGGKHG